MEVSKLDSINNLKEIMENDISLQALKFSIEACKYEWALPFAELILEVHRCLDEYVEKDTIEPIQSLSSRLIDSVQSDDMRTMYMAFVNYQLAEKFLKANQNYKAMKYFKRGVTLSNVKSMTQLRKEFAKEFLSPRAKRTQNDKKALIPIARKIWEADTSNILLPAHVARLAMRITGIKRDVDTIKDWFKEADDLIPPAIQEQSRNNTYKRGKTVNRQRELLINMLYEELSN